MMERKLQTILKKWQLNDVGMVTDAVWEDIDNDSKERFISGWRLDGAKNI
jgi:hypothetical protein